MRVDPDPPAIGRFAPLIDLFVEVIRHGHIVELHRDRRAALPNKPEVFDAERVIRARNPKASDFRVTPVTQIQQFRPGIRAEVQDRHRRPLPHSLVMSCRSHEFLAPIRGRDCIDR